MKALAAMGSNIYAGGNIFNAGGTTIPYLAKWNGTAWSAVRKPGVRGQVYEQASEGSY